MPSEDSLQGGGPPLTGCRVMEHSRTVAAAYAGRLLAAMGATVVMIEPPEGSPLRTAPPLLDGAGHSALFAFLSAGKRSLACDLLSPEGQRVLERELDGIDILIDDTPVRARQAQKLDPDSVARRFPALVHVSVLPFGASGPKADWDGEEVNLGRPAWAQDAALGDPLERSRRGDQINHHIREWMSRHDVDDIVKWAQQLGVPAAKYRTPAEVIHGEHEKSRGLFAPLELDAGVQAELLVAPFQFRCTPLPAGGRPGKARGDFVSWIFPDCTDIDSSCRMYS
jgi:crotonobetainyl-CoA:carnitine CoA-transferase CaiB-like acyl-CoA transferase